MNDTTTNKYKATIGLEIHAELKTKTKMFCSCVNNPDEEKPNVNICPVCISQPGTLPVLNKEAIQHVIKIRLACGSHRFQVLPNRNQRIIFMPETCKKLSNQPIQISNSFWWVYSGY